MIIWKKYAARGDGSKIKGHYWMGRVVMERKKGIWSFVDVMFSVGWR